MYVSPSFEASIMTTTRAQGVPGTDAPVSTSPIGPLGDLHPDDLRAYLHTLADWAADYREKIESLSIAPQVAPGDVARMTTSSPPDSPESISEIVADLDRVVMP